MRLPSKVTPFQESILSKLPILAKHMKKRDMSVTELYSVARRELDGPAEFLDALVCLYALGKLELRESSMEIHYVG